MKIAPDSVMFCLKTFISGFVENKKYTILLFGTVSYDRAHYLYKKINIVYKIYRMVLY